MAPTLRYAIRLLVVRKGSSASVVLTLALAIGVNSTLFTLVNAALLAPLPIRDVDRMVNVYTSTPEGSGSAALSYPDFLDLQAGGDVFEEVLGYSGLMATVTEPSGSEVVFGELVTANYFSVLGIAPALGRAFDPIEGEQRGAHPVVVLGDRYWRRRFGGDPSVVGRTLALNGRSYTIVGVAPRSFPGLLFRALSADIWVPVSMMGALRTDQLDNREERWMFVKARLKPGVSTSSAAAATAAVAGRLQAAYPDSNKGRTFRVVPTNDVIVHPQGDRAVLAAATAVMAAAMLVLIVACANLAGVMLARGFAREREIAIRLAIGARRRDIAQQLILEGAVLALLGGAGGLLLAWWCASILAAWRPDLPVPVSLDVLIDSRVTLFTLAVAVAATGLFAVLPALRASRTPPAGSMARAAGRRRRFLGLRDAMLVPQLAIAITLTATAGLLVRSLTQADAVRPGFDIDRTAYVALNLSMNGYDQERARRFYDDLSRALEQRGEMLAAATTSRLPLDLYGSQSMAITTNGDERRRVQVASVGAGYFAAMGIPVLRGRAFEAADLRADAPPALIVSAEAARRYWPGLDPLGREIRVAGDPTPHQVVGVAADVDVQTLGESAEPFLYYPMKTGYAGLVRLVVRTSDPARMLNQIRASIRDRDPTVAVFEARTLRSYLDVMLYPYRVAATLGIAFGAIALVLAGIGLYGVLACGVSERMRELAIRLALGARPAAVVRAASAPTLRASAAGILLGALMALVAGQLLRHVLFGTSPLDWMAIGSTALILAGVVAASSVGPVRRALAADVNALLRQ